MHHQYQASCQEFSPKGQQGGISQKNLHHQPNVMNATATATVTSPSEEDSVACLALRVGILPVMPAKDVLVKVFFQSWSLDCASSCGIENGIVRLTYT